MKQATRRLIEVGKIIGLRYCCPNEKCKAEVLYRLDNLQTPYERCPVCNEDWFDDAHVRRVGYSVDPRITILHNLRELLSSMNKVDGETLSLGGVGSRAPKSV